MHQYILWKELGALRITLKPPLPVPVQGSRVAKSMQPGFVSFAPATKKKVQDKFTFPKAAVMNVSANRLGAFLITSKTEFSFSEFNEKKEKVKSMDLKFDPEMKKLLMLFTYADLNGEYSCELELEEGEWHFIKELVRSCIPLASGFTV